MQQWAAKAGGPLPRSKRWERALQRLPSLKIPATPATLPGLACACLQKLGVHWDVWPIIACRYFLLRHCGSRWVILRGPNHYSWLTSFLGSHTFRFAHVPSLLFFLSSFFPCTLPLHLVLHFNPALNQKYIHYPYCNLEGGIILSHIWLRLRLNLWAFG